MTTLRNKKLVGTEYVVGVRSQVTLMGKIFKVPIKSREEEQQKNERCWVMREENVSHCCDTEERGLGRRKLIE